MKKCLFPVKEYRLMSNLFLLPALSVMLRVRNITNIQLLTNILVFAIWQLLKTIVLFLLLSLLTSLLRLLSFPYTVFRLTMAWSLPSVFVLLKKERKLSLKLVLSIMVLSIKSYVRILQDTDVPSVTVRRACRWIKNNQPEISDDLKSDAAARTVPIPPQLADALRAAKSAAKLPDNVLRSRTVIAKADGTPWSYSSYTSAWHAVEARSTGTVQRKRKDPVTGETVTVEDVKCLGDKIRNHNAVVSIDFKVTPHVLRHTYITRLILGRVPLKRVQYLAGHADPKVTIKIYTDLMGHAPEDLADDINAVFASIQTPPKTPLTPPEAP